jgi:hypothetical protein
MTQMLRRLRGAQLFDDLALGREAALIAFRENLLLIHADDEDSSAAADNLAVDAEFAFDLSRQTGGSGEIVSNAAVVDSNVHVVVDQ